MEGLYDDETSRTLTAGEYTLSPPDTSQSGAKMVPVYAGEFTASFPVMVSGSDSVLQSISVSVPGGTLGRYLGQVLGTEGFTLTGHYSDGDKPLSVFSVKGYDRAKRGLQTVTLSVNGKSAEIPVTVRVPADATASAVVMGTDPDYHHGHNNVFLKGQSLSLANPVFYAQVSANNVTAVFRSDTGGIVPAADVGGFDPGTPGKQTITLNLDDKAVPLTVYVADRGPEVYFDYGFMRTAADPDGWGAKNVSGRTEGCYHTLAGKKVVLAPVRALIGYDRDNNDIGVSYAWTVTPRGESPPLSPASETGEFLTLTPPEPGTWDVAVTVTGRNFIDGGPVSKSASTALICDGGTLPHTGAWGTIKNFSPGQFTESGNGYGWSLGAFGGYVIKAKGSLNIPGNGFGTWVEPGAVWIQGDFNGNGLADEMWYEINVGSDPTITRRYSLTYFKYGDGTTTNEYGQIIREIYWADSKGRTGQIGGGWPKNWGVSNADGAWVTYTGTLIADNGRIKSEYYLEDSPYQNCVDTHQTSFSGHDAIAADGTSAVAVAGSSFVKVHTAAFKYGGVFGEISTEIVPPWW